VGLGQGSDARFLLDQGTSDFALLDFPLTFQDEFFGTKIKKFPDSWIYSIQITQQSKILKKIEKKH